MDDVDVFKFVKLIWMRNLFEGMLVDYWGVEWEFVMRLFYE